MNKNNLTAIKNALSAVETHEVNYFKSLPVESFEYDEEYKSRMKEIISEHAKMQDLRYTKKILTAVVITALAIALLLTLFAFRKPLVNFAIKIFDIDTSTSNKRDVPLEKIYLPLYMPEGYRLESFEKEKNEAYLSLKDENDYVHIFQSPLEANGFFSSDTKDETYTFIYVGEQPVYYKNSYGTYTVIWENGINQFTLIASNLNWETIEKFIPSMTPFEVVEK